MKQKITLIAFMFLVSLFVFGQKSVNENNELFWKSNLDRQLETLKQNSHKARQNNRFLKNSHLSQNTSLKSSQANKQKLDSLVNQFWNEASSQWIAYSKGEFAYDANENTTQTIYYSTNETYDQWVAYFKIEYAYEPNGNMSQSLFYGWDETINQWTDPYKTEYSYDANGNMVQELSSNWNAPNSMWVENEKSEYTYDTDGNITQFIYYFWGEIASQWFAIHKEEYTYDSNSNLTQSIYYSMNETNSQWVVVLKIEYAYDASGNMTQYISYTWNESSNVWLANNKEEYTYDSNGNMTQNCGYYWDETTSQWLAVEKYEYTFEANGNLTQFIGYYMNETNGQWIAEYKYEYNYNNSFSFSDLIIPYSLIEDEQSKYYNHMLTDVLYYIWNTISSEWVLAGEDDFYYSEHNVSGVFENIKAEINIYPNPSSNHVSFSIPGNDNRTVLELFDIQGRNVLSKEIRNDEKVSLEGLKKGMYLYNLSFNGKKLKGKLIKE